MWLEKSERPSPNEPQGFWLYPGLILIAYISNGKQGDVHNGQLFETLEIMPTAVMQRYAEAMTTHELSLEFVRHNLRLGFAFTNVGCQGRSLGNFSTWDQVPSRIILVRGTITMDLTRVTKQRHNLSRHSASPRLRNGASRSRISNARISH